MRLQVISCLKDRFREIARFRDLNQAKDLTHIVIQCIIFRISFCHCVSIKLPDVSTKIVCQRILCSKPTKQLIRFYATAERCYIKGSFRKMTFL